MKWGLLSGSAAVILGVVGFGIAYASVDLPDANSGAFAQETTVYYADGKNELGTFGTNRDNKTFAEIPQVMRDAIIAAEDRDFYRNRGISPRGIARAVVNNVKGGGTQGGSTITQQYVKNVYTEGDRTYQRKAKEFLYALKVDRQEQKDTILTNYLNTIYWGRDALGVQSASQTYFGKDVSKLTAPEAAFLAGIVRGPNTYDANRVRAEARWNFVLDAMVQTGAIKAEDRAKMKFPAIKERGKNVSRLKGPSGYLLMAVRSEVIASGLIDEDKIATGGFKIYTTFDYEKQKAAEKAMAEGLADIAEREKKKGKTVSGVHVGMASVEPRTGRVLAMYGGADYNTRAFNDATQARKQAGSTFKAFTLAAALEEGYKLNEKEWQGDAPITVKTVEGGKETSTKIENSGDGGGKDYGCAPGQSSGCKIDLLTAAENSVNTAFVDVTEKIGPDKVVQAIETAGLSKSRLTGLQDVPTVTLGTAGVSPVDLANAYATIASGGRRAKAHMVYQVFTDTKNLTYEDKGDVSEQVFPQEVMQNVTYALSRVVKEGTGTAALKLDRDAAGKTGTHENANGDVVSSWFAGFTPEMATTVNFYAENAAGAEKSLKGVGGRSKFTGGFFPARIWTDYEKEALKGTPEQPLPGPTDDALIEEPDPLPTPTGDATGTPGNGSTGPSASSSPTGTGTPSATSTPSSTSTGTVPTSNPTGGPTQTPTPTCTRRPQFCSQDPVRPNLPLSGTG